MTVEIQGAIARKLGFASQQNAVAVVRELALANRGATTLRDLTLQLSADPPFISPKLWRVDQLDANTTLPITDRDITLNAALFDGLTEAVKGRLILQLQRADDVLATLESPVELLARNEWGGTADMTELLAAFVQPNDPAIDRLLKATAEVLRRAGQPANIDGYDARTRERAWGLGAALWSAVVELGLSHVLPPASFERSGQKIRPPSAVLENRVATCLDTSLLFASALEQCGLNPLIVLCKGHALAGFWLQPREFSALATDDPSALRKRIDLQDVVVFESTLVTAQPAPGFSQAIAAARRRLAPELDEQFEVVIDVRRARRQQIKPLAAIAAPSDSSDSAPMLQAPFEEAPALPAFEDDISVPEPADVTDRVLLWQRKLLDLSARNRLLNLPETGSSALSVCCPDPAALEDRLAAGTALRLKPMPTLEIAGRDPQLHEQQQHTRLQDDVAREALAQDELLSALAPDKHDAALVELYRKSRLDLSEGGANTLFVALGFLHWRKRGEEQKTYRAPLILLPARLERRSVRTGFTLRQHEDEPRFNLTLLEMLRQDFELEIPGLQGGLPSDGSGIDVARVWTLVRQATRDVAGFELREEVALGTFSFAKYLMWKDLVDRAEVLKQSPIAQHLLERRTNAYRGTGSYMPPTALDAQLDPAQLFTPLPADSSQLAAVVASASGMDFVLDGPPGTGKSQTIANMIAHNLALGRRVLFVSEKMAALSVVHRRLTAQGLGDFCLEVHSHKATKSEVLKQLERAWDASDALASEEWTKEASALRRLRDELNALVASLHRRAPNGLNLFEAIGRSVREASADTPHFDWPAGTVHDAEMMSRLREVVQRLALNARSVTGISAALATLSPGAWSNQWQNSLVTSARSVVQHATALAAARRALLDAIQIFGSQAAASDSALLALVQTLGDAHGLDLRFALGPAATEKDTLGRAALSKLARWSQGVGGLSVSYAADALRQLEASRLSAEWHAASSQGWPFRPLAQRAVRKALARAGRTAGQPDPAQDLPLLCELETIRAALQLQSAALSAVPGWAELDTNTPLMRIALDLGKRLRQQLGALARTPAELIELSAATRGLLVEGNALLAPDAAIAEARKTFAAALEASDLAQTDFARIAEHGSPLPPAEALALAEAVITHERALNAWCNWCRVRREAEGLGLQAMVRLAERDAPDVAGFSQGFEVAYARWYATWAIDADPLIREFVAAEHNAKIDTFRALDERLAQLTVRYIKTLLAGGIPRKDAALLDEGYGVLRHQLQLQRRHKAIRQLVAEMGPAFTRLAPCMLMSPLSIAQYLPPDQALFDLVIFDEASQITPWDALGAIARGRQLVVAGDHRQMPPTSFFSRGAGAADDDLEPDMESILDECKAAGLPQISLSWHYRSRHESLIAFANSRYYDNKLVTFPAAVTTTSAVRWRRVNGVYAKGKGQTNAIEAQAMADEVVRRLRQAHANQLPASLAIVTLNGEQQALVEDLLDQARRRYPELEPYFGEQLTEPVVVKNLETVQGDERDVILLGIGYGPTEPGAPTMSMNFGPLNRDGGWRRLNVAITRARREMLVFSSFPAAMVDLNRSSARAVADLKQFLSYADLGPRALPAAVRGSVGDHESPFEAAVAAGLQAAGWQVVPQIGVSRFRIDLGVVHPDRPGDYLVGIECDGAMYHSAATARDRDKVRAVILESLGWRLLRVWSTDWWIDRDGALARLNDGIEQLLANSRAAALSEAAAALPADAPAPPPEPASSPAVEATQQADTVPSPAVPIDDDMNPQAYRLAVLSEAGVVLDPDRFYEASYIPTLTKLIAYVMTQESPISEENLAVRIARAHNLQRTGHVIRERVNDIARRRFHLRRDPLGGSFYWLNASAPDDWQRARPPADLNAVRSIAEIPGEELRAAHRACVTRDPVTEIARFFGVRQLSAGARERIQNAIEAPRS